MIPIRQALTKENLLSKVSSYDIFRHYSGNFREVGVKFNSDFREDLNPSCSVAQIKGDLLYTDFGTGKSYRAVDFVKELLGLDFFQALQQINLDFNLGLGSIVTSNLSSKGHNGIITSKKQFIEKSHTTLKKKQRPFTKKDLEYWNSFYWTEWMLKEAKTQSISHYWINGQMWIVKSDELAFSYEYYWHKGRQMRKIYLPERIKFKWFSNVDNTICQLVDVMPKIGDVLFITSSKKDAGIFWRMQLDNMFPNLVMHAVSPNNEGSFVPEKWFLKAQNRYKHIIIWYNNDDAGIKNAKKYSEQYNIPYYYNPEGTPKDPSDFSKKYNIEEFYKLVKNKIDVL